MLCFSSSRDLLAILCNRRYGNMAESKGALIAKTVQKHAGRAKEKVSKRTSMPAWIFRVITDRFLVRSRDRRDVAHVANVLATVLRAVVPAKWRSTRRFARATGTDHNLRRVASLDETPSRDTRECVGVDVSAKHDKCIVS